MLQAENYGALNGDQWTQAAKQIGHFNPNKAKGVIEFGPEINGVETVVKWFRVSPGAVSLVCDTLDLLAESGTFPSAEFQAQYSAVAEIDRFAALAIREASLLLHFDLGPRLLGAATLAIQVNPDAVNADTDFSTPMVFLGEDGSRTIELNSPAEINGVDVVALTISRRGQTGDLSALIENLRVADWSLEERRQRVIDILGSLEVTASELRYIHGQGVVHRDVKSGNITPEGYLIDFGIGSTSLLPKYAVFTPGHVDPLDVLDTSATNSSADAFSLSITLVEALSGNRLGNDPSLMSGLSKHYWEYCNGLVNMGRYEFLNSRIVQDTADYLEIEEADAAAILEFTSLARILDTDFDKARCARLADPRLLVGVTKQMLFEAFSPESDCNPRPAFKLARYAAEVSRSKLGITDANPRKAEAEFVAAFHQATGDSRLYDLAVSLSLVDPAAQIDAEDLMDALLMAIA